MLSVEHKKTAKEQGLFCQVDINQSVQFRGDVLARNCLLDIFQKILYLRVQKEWNRDPRSIWHITRWVDHAMGCGRKVAARCFLQHITYIDDQNGPLEREH